AAEKSSIRPVVHVGISGEFYFGANGENSPGIDSRKHPPEEAIPLEVRMSPPLAQLSYADARVS
ncbi:MULTISPECIES: hypothetical protein, partial [unclassified Rhizobium]|uniref:hypothetical protein n=1 Tax=unclassified Rhizobium TaxID=2613769 RepID=UPI001FD7BE8E